MEKVLLHSCCAPCSAAILEWMGQNGYEPTILFYNPNIFPEEEYLKRKHEIVRYAQEIGVAIVDLDGENTGEKDNAEVSAGYEGTDGRQGGHGDFWERQHEQWLECTVGLENEPERGGRCLACFKHRLCTAASYAANRGFPLFTTTLASSRWKDIRQINEAGFYAEEHLGPQLAQGRPLRTPQHPRPPVLQPAVLRLRVQPCPPHCAPKQLLTFRQTIKHLT